MNYIGDFPEDFTTVTVLFTTHDGNGAPVAPLSGFEADDVKIYKNGSGTQKTSTNGLTMTSPFDTITGLHCLVIDTSNDTGDAAFWVTGATYSVVLNPDTETVNSQSVVKVLATFGICLAPALRPTTAGRTLVVDAAGLADANMVKAGPTGSGTAQTARDLGGQLDAAITTRMATYTQPTGFLAATFPGTVASTTNISAGTITTATNVTTVNGLAAGVVTAAAVADGAIDAATFASGALDAVWSTAARTLTAGTNIQLPSNGLANVTAWTVAITGNITGNLSGSVGSVTGLTASNLDATISSRMATYVQPTGFLAATFPSDPADQSLVIAATDALATLIGDVPTNSELNAALASADDATLAAISALDAKFTFTVPGYADVNIRYVNSVQVNGDGAGTPWGP